MVNIMKRIVLWIVVVSLLIMSISMNSLYQRLVPLLKEYGKMEVERFNQLIITHCKFTNEKQYEDMIVVERNNDNEITFIDFDMIKVNSIANDVVLDIENTYALIEEGKYIAGDDSYYERRLEEVSKSGIVSKVSVGSLLNMPFLSNVTPTLSIQYKHLSSVSSDIVKEISNYGMNYIMIQLSIKVNLKLRMIYPFFEQYHVHEVEIPVLLDIVEGQIPFVYYEGESSE